MSEYAVLGIRSLYLYEFRNYLQSDIVRLFFTRKDYTCIPQYYGDLSDEDAQLYMKHVYKTTVERAKQRLDALGYSVSNFEKLFERTVHEAVYYDTFLSLLHVASDLYKEKADARIDKYVSFKKWKNSMSKIIRYELDNGSIWSLSKETLSDVGISTEYDKVIYYLIKDEYRESFYGIDPDVIQLAFVFRLVLDNCELSDEIMLDFSNFDGWVENSISLAISATKIEEKIIVLVEGTSDKSIFEFALEKIYPHLSDLFYFMDYNDEKGNKREGGTSFLIKSMDLFFFLRLKAKFIAIFDNDAEGYRSKCAFSGCSSLTGITIPDGVTSIETETFYNCSRITNIIIPNSVTSIGYRAFHSCSSLESITIPEGLTSVDGNAFELTPWSENLSDDFIIIGKNILYKYNGNKENVVIPDSVSSIADHAFCFCSDIKNVTISDSVTSIGSSAFLECSNLKSITIPDSVTSIGKGTFCGCSNLKSITMPNGLTSIGEGAFCGCSNLKSITIPIGVTSIEKDTFCGCSSLTSITIPNSVTSIGESAFRMCSSLKNITIPDSVTSIAEDAFYNLNRLK